MDVFSKHVPFHVKTNYCTANDKIIHAHGDNVLIEKIL